MFLFFFITASLYEIWTKSNLWSDSFFYNTEGGQWGGGDSTTTEWRLFDVCSQREEIECSPFKVSFLI